MPRDGVSCKREYIFLRHPAPVDVHLTACGPPSKKFLIPLTYSIARNVWKEINYFAGGSANAYSGFHGSQITCTGEKLLVDGLEIDNIVMYVTEELLYRNEKFISREDDDRIIVDYNNVRLTCPAKD